MISFEATRALLFPQDGALERSLACWHWVTQAVGDTLPIGLRIPLTSADPGEAWHRLDGVGTPYALCDLNVLGDCFEALVLLHQAWPESDLLPQLEALRDQLLSLVHRATGTVQFFFNSVGEVGPGHHWRIGQTWQLVKRILQAEVILPITPETIGTLKPIVWNTIERAWDRMGGGFFFALPHCLPDSIEGHDLVVRRKSWWVQFEALAALDAVAVTAHFDKATRVTASEYTSKTLTFIEQYLLDEHSGGFFDHVANSDENKTDLFKGGAWKDASHETLCLSQLLERAG
ncbi:AGE family epimerase/isomerase [Synechococcus sp. CCY9201]|uniref:AGE family epimerase/isomerase n=1 Tax=Synechococcus sp. CCY9201 TaxID=174697 RepID=UPI002B20F3E0|nr:AGE family epimerase/isomerase [Synechococcus sp. CCY9201]MEA5474112.1 AGE family epimerase/isomerase [Synechococcus sp. CCY9201]